MAAKGRIRVGVYGLNGHQIHQQLAAHPDAELAAVAAFDTAQVPPACQGVRVHATLADLLRDRDVDLVSLCAPRRVDQARAAVACLNAGKHVYAEKPCALTEADLDAIIHAAKRTGMAFHEMAGTLCDSPYRQMRAAVLDGRIGRVVQVVSQKSYPWHDQRPSDEDMDGGLLLQVGVYAARFVEHIACERIASIRAVESRLGNPLPDHACRLSAAILMTMAGGGTAAAVCNYLNPIRARCHGYEILRIFGTKGAIETNADGNVTRLLLNGKDPEILDTTGPAPSHLDLFLAALRGRGEMPLSLEEEVSPTRWVIRARSAVETCRCPTGGEGGVTPQ